MKKPKTQKILLIGGTWDGLYQEISKDNWKYNIVKKMNEHVIESYVKFQKIKKLNLTLFCLSGMSIEDIFTQLVKGYRKPT